MTDNTESAKSINERLEQARNDLRDAAEKLQEAVRKAGENAENRLQSLREELKKTAEQLRAEGVSKTARSVIESSTINLRGLANQAVSSLGLPTNDDVEALNKKVESLSRKIRKLEKAEKSEKASAA